MIWTLTLDGWKGLGWSAKLTELIFGNTFTNGCKEDMHMKSVILRLKSLNIQIFLYYMKRNSLKPAWLYED